MFSWLSQQDSAYTQYVYLHKQTGITPARMANFSCRLCHDILKTSFNFILAMKNNVANEPGLNFGESQFRSAFEFSAIGMALAKPDGSLFEANRSLCKMMGYSHAELLKFTFQDLTHPDDLETDLDLFRELTDGKRESYEMEKRYVHADGHIIYALLAVSAVKNNHGKIDHLIKQIQDISQIKAKELMLKRLNETIKESNDALTYKNEELENYAFVASHDLQEPLRMVTGFLSKIEKKYQHLLDEDGKKYIHFAMDGAQRMRMLILNILEYSTIAKQDESNATEVDLNLIVKEVLDDLTLKNTIDVSIQMDILPIVKGITVSMQQLFSNLISNAIKYQPAGNKPVVKISVSDKLDAWEFSITDNGIGIDARGLKLVFNIFQRLHSKEQYSGTGIGLAICKRIITNLKGRIWAESVPGKGTTFYFTIPK